MVPPFVAAALFALWGCKGSEEVGPLIAAQPGKGVDVVPVRVALGEGVDVAEAQAVFVRAQAFMADCGLGLQEVQPARRVALKTLFGARLESSGASGEQRDVGKTLRAMVKRFAPPASGWVQLVLLKAVSSPGSVARRALGSLDGVGLRSGDPEFAKLGLPQRFGPIVFARPKAYTIVHELGHALGLDHRTSQGEGVANLMAPGSEVPGRCRLDRDQQRVIRAELERLAENRKR